MTSSSFPKSAVLCAKPLAPALISRRSLLAGAAATGVALAASGFAVLGTSNAFAASVAADDFLRLSEFVTGGSPLSAGLATRYLAALTKSDTAFAAAAQALHQHVASHKFSHVDDLLAVPDLDPALRATAAQIVSAWYLGVVGEDADAVLISYANALMYRPTAGILDIPTYGSGPDSWGTKPVVPASPNKKSPQA